MANFRNDWQGLLKLANDELKERGMEMRVFHDGPGVEVDDNYYTVSIKKGDEEEIFAENYFENELSDCITEAWHHALLQ